MICVCRYACARVRVCKCACQSECLFHNTVIRIVYADNIHLTIPFFYVNVTLLIDN